MAISTIYHVWVELPSELSYALSVDDKLNQQWDKDVMNLLTEYRYGSSGTETYGVQEEWADFHSMNDAKEYEKELNRLIKRYMSFIPTEE